MHELRLSGDEVEAVTALLRDTASRYGSVEDAAFLEEVYFIAQELPPRVRKFVCDFKHLERPPGVCRISGHAVNDLEIGETPAHWGLQPRASAALAEEMLLILYGSLLGEVFGWATQQGGRLVHDILPIKEHESAQLGSGSSETLYWHSEDAFHPYRGDYLGLMCLRNTAGVATTFASADSLRLTPDQFKVLSEPRYTIRPDESHLRQSWLDATAHAGGACLENAYRCVERMNSSPKRVALLFGDPQVPYMCLDLVYMEACPDDEEAEAALRALIRAVNASLQEFVLRPGDYCFIDNYRCVHGRRAFEAHYDGSDRWLKRINVTRDLRKSRGLRGSLSSRIIF